MANKETEPTARERPPMLFRQMVLEVETRAAGEGGAQDDRIPVALSSESPVERVDWWQGERYLEVLDHTKDGVDLSYAQGGLPFLLDHDLRQQVGLIEDVHVDGDKKIRGMIRMGNHPDAAWLEKDLRQGIRPRISVGYDPGDQYEQSAPATKGGLPTRRYKGWRPMEGSSVAVPADMTVGIGRSADDRARPTGITPVELAPEAKERRMSEAIKDPATPAGAADEGVKRIEGLTALAKEHKRMGELGEWLKSGRSVAEQSALLVAEAAIAAETTRARAVAPVASGTNEDDPYGIPFAERKNKIFSVVRAMRAVTEGSWDKAGFEREVSARLAKLYNREPQSGMGFFMPTYWGVRATGQLDTATSNQGAEFVFTEPGSVIELLRNKAFVLQAGARIISGLQGNVAFPRQTGAGTFTWNGEAPTSGVALSNLTLDQLTLSPKTGQSATSISKRLIVQGVVGAEQFVRDDIMKIHALAIDAAALNGSGANNQPTGILKNTSIGSVTMGTNGATITSVAPLIDLETTVAAANADLGRLAYFTTPGQRGTLKKTLQFTSSIALPIWTGSTGNGEVNGYPAYATVQVPKNLTKGTATTICSAVIFGNFDDLIIGEWGTMEVTVDPYTLADRNMLKVVSLQMLDIGIRHAASFAAIQDAL